MHQPSAHETYGQINLNSKKGIHHQNKWRMHQLPAYEIESRVEYNTVFTK
ncbi:hypothetical protein HYC85_029032 [Camellia sinensis]|uniref:Uncharacterized protein n=1 Tax=Camellia sinensis TaxID=4442 RepID=A0A7J7FY11_CAMSI|nr:hypothetical protein HYC85_029032 [Camellia sinensis]